MTSHRLISAILMATTNLCSFSWRRQISAHSHGDYKSLPTLMGTSLQQTISLCEIEGTTSMHDLPSQTHSCSVNIFRWRRRHVRYWTGALSHRPMKVSFGTYMQKPEPLSWRSSIRMRYCQPHRLQTANAVVSRVRVLVFHNLDEGGQRLCARCGGSCHD
jgi:hypothetical protein